MVAQDISRAQRAGRRHPPQGAPVNGHGGPAAFRIVALGVIAAVVLAVLRRAAPPRPHQQQREVRVRGGAQNFAPTTTYVRPSDANASSQLSTHPARLTIDLIKETYWAANTSSDKQPWIRLSFGGSVDLDEILITSGAANDYASLARPKLVELVFSDKTTCST